MTVKILPDAYRQIQDLPSPVHRRVLTILSRLQKWPAVSGVKPLSGSLAGHFRVRTGDYRLQFHVHGAVVVVEKVGHRDGFYE